MCVILQLVSATLNPKYIFEIDLSRTFFTGFVRALEILENLGKFLKPWTFFYEALENITERF